MLAPSMLCADVSPLAFVVRPDLRLSTRLKLFHHVKVPAQRRDLDISKKEFCQKFNTILPSINQIVQLKINH